MGILVNENTRVLIQGITGRLGSRQTKLMRDAGTNILAGVTPGKGGETVYGVPVYDTVKDAVKEQDIDALPTGFEMLLTTGGPALKIVGKLNQYGEAENPVMQIQDWFTPWSEYTPDMDDFSEALDWFVGLFYFGS